MKLNTYLFFEDQCAAAFDFYKSVFGGEFSVMQTFADGPPEMGVPEAEKSRIMHISLPIGDDVLMGSDTVSNQGEAPVTGTNFSVSLDPKSKEEADRIFPKLAEGGETVMAMQDTFWGAYFGMCVDKFGIRWMVNVDTSAG